MWGIKEGGRKGKKRHERGGEGGRKRTSEEGRADKQKEEEQVRACRCGGAGVFGLR